MLKPDCSFNIFKKMSTPSETNDPGVSPVVYLKKIKKPGWMDKKIE